MLVQTIGVVALRVFLRITKFHDITDIRFG